MAGDQARAVSSLTFSAKCGEGRPLGLVIPSKKASSSSCSLAISARNETAIPHIVTCVNLTHMRVEVSLKTNLVYSHRNASPHIHNGT